MSKILVIDSDQEVCRSLEGIFSSEGYLTASAGTGQSALSRIAEEDFDIIFVDSLLPDMRGFDVLKEAKKRLPACHFIVITDSPSIESAIDAIKLGADDYIRKPLLPEKIKVITKKAIEFAALEEEVEFLRQAVSRNIGFFNAIGKSGAMREVFPVQYLFAPCIVT